MTLLCMIAIRAYSPDEARDDRGRWTGDQSITPGEGSYKAWVGPKGEQHVFEDLKEHAYNPPPGMKLSKSDLKKLDLDSLVTRIQNAGYTRVIRQGGSAHFDDPALERYAGNRPDAAVIHYDKNAPGGPASAQQALLSLKMGVGSRIGVDNVAGLTSGGNYKEFPSTSTAMAYIMHDKNQMDEGRRQIAEIHRRLRKAA